MVNCEYMLLRYVPDLVKNEYVNFGLIMFDSSGVGFAAVRFAKDLRRVQCLAPNIDLEVLHGMQADFKRDLRDAKSRAELLRMINTSFSNSVQVSESFACQTESAESELAKLAEMYLEPSAIQRERHKRAAVGRPAILSEMKAQLRQSGALPLLWTNVSVAKYTHAGDPFAFDFGYRYDSTFKFLQALSLRGGPDSAKLLAFSFRQAETGIEKIEEAQARLTAVVENELDREDDEIKCSLNALEESRIAIAAVSEMPKIAESVRKDLRL
jgi:hypothetical protein